MTSGRVLPPFASPASRHRLLLARELIACCPPELGTEIALTGSVARGVADSLSDIEINCWVDRLPERGAWISWLTGAGAELVDSPAIPFLDDGWLWTGCRYRGIWIEIGWHELERFEALIGRVTSGEESGERRLQIGWIVRSAIPLRAQGMLQSWQERLTHYPDALQETLIRRNTEAWSDPHVPAVRWALAARNERAGLANRLIWDVNNILGILCAINRRWPQDWKWTDERSLDFPIKPERLSGRIGTIFSSADPAVAVRTCMRLILDSLALVPSGIDVNAARENVESALARRPRVTRGCAAVVRDESILMVECRHATFSHWSLPGGRIEEGESPEQAALRELAEEAGMQGTIASLIYTRPWGRDHGEGLEACFLVEVDAGAEPALGRDPELEQQDELVAVAWRPLAELGDDLQVMHVLAALAEHPDLREKLR
jgi:8-oxo-dGTP pyrophosphatase MutT (NUDIX family)